MSPKSPLPARILIPVANPGTAEELIRLGAAMLDPRQGELTALGIVEVPEGMPLSEGATRARHARRLLQKVLDYAPQGTAIHPIVRIGRHAAEGIIEASAEQEADLIIFGWGGRNPPGTDRANGPIVFSPTIDEVVRESPADIAVVKQRGSRDIRRVLVPVRGGPHAELAVRYADAIATHHGATVVVLHLVPPGITMAVRAQAERALAAFIKQHLHGSGEGVLREAPNVRNAILREAEKADLVVMGASAVPGGDGDQTYLFGALPEAVAARAKPSVVVVKTRESIGGGTFDALASRAETLAAADRAAEEARAIPTRVERWFGESNFHHAEFSDLRRLVQLKDKQGVTISLVLPTLDEEETIGPIVRRAFREMVGRVPLLDEILVIDSASSDRTREIAEAEGARVVQHPDVLSRYGSFRGKGEALWKSLFETTGDLVVWADTDVRNWHPRMVYGTLGPLLHEPRLQYVKGYYQRPIVVDGVLKEGGGGRVTELVARPLINLFYPELSGMIQPLSGEYAGRRTLLESIPFFTGYAVEIGHLIDTAERVGIEGLGQVDLERRVHRNQELEGLSRMSFVILQAVMKRLEERRKARLFAELGSTMKLPRSGKGRLSLEVIELADQERPPMIRIPEYLERRGGRRIVTEGPDGDSEAIRIEAIDDAQAFVAAIPGLATVTVDAVESGSGVNFLDGATEAETGAWWAARTERVADGTITVFVARDGDRIVGSTLLERSTNPNSPHRAEIGKVIVLRSYRRRGLGAALMDAAEARARADGRWLLLLDTVEGSAAEAMYRALGWTAFGVVPNHALLPDGTPWPTTYFWKDLR